MNRAEFLERLITMYSNSFNNNNSQIWMNGYKKVLPENLDFDRLFEILITEYLSIHTAPAPAWFTPYVSILKPKIKKEVEKIIDGVPPPKEFLDLRKKLKQNITTKSKVMEI